MMKMMMKMFNKMMMMLMMMMMMKVMMMKMMMMMMFIFMMKNKWFSETTMMHFHMPDVQNHCFAIAACLFSIHIMSIFTTAAEWSLTG